MPPDLQGDADCRLLQKQISHKRQIIITDLINRRFNHSTDSRDYEFSRAPVHQWWETGLDEVRRSL